jgi:hypothetical protein
MAERRIFAPLDPADRLPRERILERPAGLTWGFPVSRRHLAGFLWAPALLATLALVTWWLGSVLATLATAGLLLVAFAVFAFRRDP